MTYKQIATVLNNSIMRNYLGEETTIAEDLSNIVEVGNLISTMTSDDLKTFQKQLVVGVRNEVLSRLYEVSDYGIIKDTIQYGGALQRITAVGNYSTQDSHILNLVNGESYLDGKYYGTGIDSRIYTSVKAFKVVHSISEDNFSQMFMDAYSVAQFMGLIAETEINTINANMQALQDRLIMMGITTSYDSGRKIQLLTEFNKKTGSTHTLADIYANRELTAYFSDFCKEVIFRLLDYVKRQNKKYNDGTVLTFCPTDKAKVILNTEFAGDIKFIGDAIDYNVPEIASYMTSPSWQNSTDKILPSIADTAKIVTTEGGSKEYANIVGYIYDRDSMGITNKLDKVTSEYVGTEGFTNLHHHCVANYYIDNRFTGVVITLD